MEHGDKVEVEINFLRDADPITKNRTRMQRRVKLHRDGEMVTVEKTVLDVDSRAR